VTASSIKPDTTFVDINLRRIAKDKAGADDEIFDKVRNVTAYLCSSKLTVEGV
jgi:hypothetical protein